jgi:hypothetical protein
MSTARADGARAPRPESTGHDLPIICCKCMFQVFQMFQRYVFRMDVAKVVQDVAYFASVSEACCKRLFKIFHLFQTYVARVFI